jgi:hypothetical protein
MAGRSLGPAAYELTTDEEALVTRIKFDASTLHRPEDVERNGMLAAALMKSLSERSAIPEIRLCYFTDPDYFVDGRGRSRREMGERNGSGGEETFRHPDFLVYLHYFLYGPSLPQNIVDAFLSELENCADLSSGNIVTLGRFAREQARAHALEPARAAEEFYKLALEAGLSVSCAELIRKSVKRKGGR